MRTKLTAYAAAIFVFPLEAYLYVDYVRANYPAGDPHEILATDNFCVSIAIFFALCCDVFCRIANEIDFTALAHIMRSLFWLCVANLIDEVMYDNTEIASRWEYACAGLAISSPVLNHCGISFKSCLNQIKFICQRLQCLPRSWRRTQK